MSSSRPPRTPGRRPGSDPGSDRTVAHLPLRTSVAVSILLLIPLVALALVPTYANAKPRLFGFPFFYWYSMMWVPITAALTYTAYYLIARARGVK